MPADPATLAPRWVPLVLIVSPFGLPQLTSSRSRVPPLASAIRPAGMVQAGSRAASSSPAIPASPLQHSCECGVPISGLKLQAHPVIPASAGVGDAAAAPQRERSRDVERFVTFLDAIAAIAITLLVLPLVELTGELSGDVEIGELLRER